MAPRGLSKFAPLPSPICQHKTRQRCVKTLLVLASLCFAVVLQRVSAVQAQLAPSLFSRSAFPTQDYPASQDFAPLAFLLPRRPRSSICVRAARKHCSTPARASAWLQKPCNDSGHPASEFFMSRQRLKLVSNCRKWSRHLCQPACIRANVTPPTHAVRWWLMGYYHSIGKQRCGLQHARLFLQAPQRHGGREVITPRRVLVNRACRQGSTQVERDNGGASQRTPNHARSSP